MGLFSWLGNKISQPAARPESRPIEVGKVNNRWSNYPSYGLTPERLRGIIWGADQGDMRYLMELYEEMEEKDAHLAAVLQTRKLAVAGLPLEIQPASDSAQDKEIGGFVEEVLGEIPDLQNDLLDMLDAVAKGYAATEIHWDYRNKRAVVVDLEWLHPKCITFVNSPTPLIITESNGAGAPPPAWKLIFHAYRGRSGDICRAGVLRACLLPYLLKSYNWKDWARYNELFGIPFRLGKYNSTASQQDRDALVAGLQSMGSDAYAAVSENTNIEFPEPASKSGGGKILPHQAMIDACNREMSKAVLGQTLTTDTTGATGTYAAGKVHEEVRQDLVQADKISLEAALRDQLVRPLVGFNFGWDKPLPKVMLAMSESIDLEMESRAIMNLAAAGLEITDRHCYERFAIMPPEKGDKVLGLGLGGRDQGLEEEKGSGARGQGPEKAQKSMKAVLSSRGDLPAAAVAQELENLTQAAHTEAQEYLGRMLQPVAQLIEDGASLEDIQDKLTALYGRLDKRDLAVLLGQVRIMAHLRGRVKSSDQ